MQSVCTNYDGRGWNPSPTNTNEDCRGGPLCPPVGVVQISVPAWFAEIKTGGETPPLRTKPICRGRSEAALAKLVCTEKAPYTHEFGL